VRPNDSLLQLLIEFFELPSDASPESLTQQAVSAWDSLASVQLVAELQAVFNVNFDLDELESLRSYEQICAALCKKGISPHQRLPE
jgi:acyl carrier protein